MKRLCVMVVGFVYAAAGTVEAESPSVPRPKTARPHVAKTATLNAAATKSAGLSGINFSDPYAPPVGTQKNTIARFPQTIPEPHVNPQGGFSFSAGRDSPDAPFTGGLKFRF